MSFAVRRHLRTKYKSDIAYAGGIYHVTQRAPGRELLFIDEDDYLRMIALFKESAETFDLDVFAFCCMPNHIHLLLRTNKDNLIIAMKCVFERYAKYFNRKYNRKGHVFCGTFAAALCEQDDYFLTISLYIHLNPCAAGIAHDPANYRWCSVRVYVESILETFINRRYLLDLLDKDTNTAREIYRNMLEATRNIKVRKFIFDNKDSAEFKLKIVKALKRKEAFSLIINRVFHKVADNDEIRKVTAVKGQRICSEDEQKRRRYIIEQLRAEGYSTADIAQELNLAIRTVYHLLNQK